MESKEIRSLHVAGGYIKARDMASPIGVVVLRPPVEEVLSKQGIKSLEQRGYLPKNRRLSNFDPKVTVFNVEDALDVSGNIQTNPEHAAFNLYRVIKDIIREEVQVNYIISDNPLKTIRDLEI